ncbi:MAG: DNA-directed RNA polymerase subunit H [Candidatus Thermoplasmatota archaeon]|nr:DNA-directed RNA polymerase subunit H [Candidatus Thermoplasmatota archaeon]|tara:strand:- start:9 stop:593 length:585 start_codon:yes stop_codon:yes gene_type:complete
MAVKSSTKKKLIELGVDEGHASKLADDTNLSQLKMLSSEQIGERISLPADDKVVEKYMALIREQPTRTRRSRSVKRTISQKLEDEDIIGHNDRFNVLNHELVPHHELVPVEDEAKVLSPWSLMTTDAEGNQRLAKERLPKILINDPAVQILKEMEEAQVEGLPAGWLTNRVVKVVRYSRSAGASTAYRLIVEAH